MLGAKTHRVKVVRVTAQEFELSDGRVYQHPVELDVVPSPQEFQRIYDRVAERFAVNDWLGLNIESC
jgi:hypothetical protein